MNPMNPCFFAPSTGFVNTPAIPFPKPDAKENPAYLNPSLTLFAFFIFIFSLELKY
jgi:hypothetical protein